jgi:hypothetical protein
MNSSLRRGFTGSNFLMMVDGEIDSNIANAKWYFIGGVVAIALMFVVPPQSKVAIFTGLTLIQHSFYALVLCRWRSDRGLWMLAAFFALTLTPIWAYFEWLRVQEFFREEPFIPAQPGPWGRTQLLIDATLALGVFSHTCRFIASAGVRNWAISRAAAQ